MSDRFTTHGAFIWCELLTTDVEGAKKFYGNLLGWTLEDMTAGGMQYTVLKAGAEEMAGIREYAKIQDLTPIRFYHLKLRCHVVIELKAGKFKPEHLGQLGFYLTAIDDRVKSEQDNPTIGLLLCKSKNKVVAEYALRALCRAEKSFGPERRVCRQG